MALRDAHDPVVAEQRLPNALHTILAYLAPDHAELTGLVVEATYNGYGLVDGLCEAGDRVHLAHRAAIKPSAGRKLSTDQGDARWLAHLRRVAIFSEGYSAPKGERAVRDRLRQRAHLVRQKVTPMLSIPSPFARHTGHALGTNRIRHLCANDVERPFAAAHVALAVTRQLRIRRGFESPIQCLERTG
jgi:hypothetical protein